MTKAYYLLTEEAVMRHLTLLPENEPFYFDPQGTAVGLSVEWGHGREYTRQRFEEDPEVFELTTPNPLADLEPERAREIFAKLSRILGASDVPTIIARLGQVRLPV